MILYPKNKDEYYSDSRETRLALRGVLDSDFHIIQPVRCPCCGGYLILSDCNLKAIFNSGGNAYATCSLCSRTFSVNLLEV